MEPTVIINPTKIATKWALINAATAIVLTYVFEFSSIEQASPIRYVMYVPFVVFLFLTQKDYKDQLGGYLTFRDGFSTGFRYALFTGLLIGVFVYLYLAILSPEIFEQSIASSQAAMEDKGMSSGDVEKFMNITRKWGPVFGAFGSAIFYALVGALISLVGAAILKKERSAHDIIDDAIDPTV